VKLSLLEYPGSIAFLDDERHFLDGLSVAVPDDFVCTYFQKPQRCIDTLLNQMPLWQKQKNTLMQAVSNNEEQQTLLESLVNDLYADLARFDLITLLVVDYQMPAMNGLAVLEQLKDWPGKRVMLTGQADEQLAVEAFNRGLIDHFIPKQAPDSLARLITVASVLRCEGAGQCGEALQLKLSAEQQRIVASASFANAINTRARQAQWVEHAILAEPFGVLGITASGQMQWLQLETEATLVGLAEIMEDAEYPQPLIEQVRAGNQLLAIELPAAVLDNKPQPQAAMTLLQEPRVVAQLTTLASKAASYAAFCSSVQGQSKFL
jgi:CheY-like chemotaxis protein